MRVAHFELQLEFLYLEAHAPGVAKLDTFFVRRPLTTGESVASNRPMLSIRHLYNAERDCDLHCRTLRHARLD